MICTLEKRKGRGGQEETKGEGCEFTGVVHSGLAGKGRFEQRLEGGEEVSPVDIRDNCSCQLRQADAWGVPERQSGQCGWSRARRRRTWVRGVMARKGGRLDYVKIISERADVCMNARECTVHTCVCSCTSVALSPVLPLSILLLICPELIPHRYK